MQPLDDPETQEALATIRKLFKTPTSAKEIRKQLDDQVFDFNNKFLESFGKIHQDVEELGAAIDELEAQLRDMEDILQEAVDETRYIIDTTKDLNQKAEDAKRNQESVKTFLEQYTLTPEEIQILSSANEPLSGKFFKALQHLEQIHHNCQALLVADNQQAGLDIMDSMNSYQEIAYERLFKWTQAECRMMRNEFPEISAEFRLAMHSFRLRPILFEYSRFM
jgi:chromosome segregation ATPase